MLVRNYNSIYMVICLATILGIFLCPNEVLAKGRRSSSGYKRYRGAKAIDGDTYRYRSKRYRIQEYNAPEIGQRGSRKATTTLQNKIDSGNYGWKPVARDVYGRTIVSEQQR